jgi:probable rRNA maturation factor
MAKIGVFNSCSNIPKEKIPSALIRNLVKEILPMEKKDFSLDIIFFSDKEMTKLNKKFTKRDQTTDVLSFNLQEKGNDFLGEIYISLDQAKRQAKEYGVALKEELCRLVVHGVLHLLGYDHKSIRERKVMREKEEKYFSGMKKK